MSGAVDLAALKARNEAAARAADAPPPPPGAYVFDVIEVGFQADVVDRSFQVPVLLVLTSPRAPSSDQLVTSLTTLVNAQQGKVVLGRVDADANPRIVQALQAQGVPAVYAVISGQPVPGFEGALPDDQIREFVRAVLDAGAQAGLTGVPATAGDQATADAPPEEPEDPRFTAAEQALEAGEYDLAAQRYQAILDHEPANQDAALALGQVHLMQRLETVDRDAVTRADAAPDDIDLQLAAADVALATNDVPAALERLLLALVRADGDDRDRVRQRLLEFFELLGPDDPRVPPARRALTRALF